MKIIDECWLTLSDTIELDLNQAKWAAEGATYYVYGNIAGDHALGTVHPLVNNIIDKEIFSKPAVIYDAQDSAIVHVTTLSNWTTYVHELKKTRSIFGVKTWKERFRLLKRDFHYEFLSAKYRPPFPTPFPRPRLQLPTYDEALGSNK